MALSAKGVGYCYSAASGCVEPALADVSVTVEAGELVLVLGATGSGKSTLLRLLSGLLAPTEGKLVIDGEPLTASSARGTVGLVFQDPESQLFAETILDDVAFGPRNLGASREEAFEAARDAMERVGLPAETFAGRSPFALSGGEARRAAIAGVLAMHPRYLLLDEPTSGLDSRGRRAVHELVRAERARCGVVVVSHSAGEFLGEADRVLVLVGGKATFADSGSELVARPEVFAAAGLCAPDVLRVQQLAAEKGAALAGYTLDVEAAARALAEAVR
jgi:energy-coupling factor transport system ATP-binding protein